MEGAVALPIFVYGTKGLYDSIDYDDENEEFDFDMPSYGKPTSAALGGLLLTDSARRYSGKSWADVANGTAYAMEGLDEALQAYNDTF